MWSSQHIGVCAMKKVLGILLGVLLSASVSADVIPYAGVDVQSHEMNFQGGLGRDLFSTRRIPQMNLYGGFRLNPYLSIEGGYEYSVNNTTRVNLEPGDVGLAGVVQGSSEGHHYSSRISGHHINLRLDVKADRMGVFAMGGIARKKLSLKDDWVSDGGSPIPVQSRTLEKHRTIVRLSGGLIFPLTETAGLRGMVSWENTAQFKNMRPKENPNSPIRCSAANSLIYGIGIYMLF